MQAKFFNLAIAAMLTIALVGCGDSKSRRARKSSPSDTSTAASDKPAESTQEKPAETKPTEVADVSTSSTPAPAAGGWGNLKGKFIYNGTAAAPAKIDATKDPVCAKHDVLEESLIVGDDGGMANIVVWVRTKDVKIHPDYEGQKNKSAVIDNVKCQFNPRIVPYWTGQPMEVKNSDPTSHNTNVAAIANPAFNEVIPAEKSTDKKPFENAESTPIVITCNIHPWMKGYMVVQPHPYVAVSGKDGSFELKNLPAGTELEIQVWQEKSGYVQKAEIGGKDAGWAKGRFKYTVKPGDNDLGTIKLDPAQFNK